MLRPLLALFLVSAALPAQESEELRYAVVVTRHGVRAPTWTLDRLNAYSSSPWPDFGVPPSHLTPHGRRLMALMGAFYRDSFQRKGLPGLKDCSAVSQVHIRADVDQRTLESAKAIAETLLPGCAAKIDHVKEDESDPVFSGPEERDSEAESALAMAAVMGRIGPDLNALTAAHRDAFDLLNSILRGSGTPKKSLMDEKVGLEAKGSSVSMTGPLRLASTFTENLLLEYTNGMKGSDLGWGRLDESKLLSVMSLHTAYADLLRRTPRLARARGQSLIRVVAASLQQAATGKPVPGALGSSRSTLLLLSGHDTNISNLSGILDLTWTLPGYQQDDVPPGGALVFTLWRSKSKGEWRVRTQFISQTLEQMREALPLSADQPPAIADLFVPACSTAHKGYPCSLNGFLSAAR